MSIGKDDSIRRCKACDAVGTAAVTLGQLVGSLAIRRAFFGDSLIVRSGRSAAAMTEQYNLADLLCVPEIINPALHVEGDQLPVHQSFVVVEARIHTQDHQPSL